MRASALSYELSYQIFRLIANSPLLHAKKSDVSEQGSDALARAACDGYRVARNGSKSKQAVGRHCGEVANLSLKTELGAVSHDDNRG